MHQLQAGKETVKFLAIFDHLRQAPRESFYVLTPQRFNVLALPHIPLVQIHHPPYSIQPMRHILVFPLAACLIVSTVAYSQTNTNAITRETVAEAEKLIGLDLSESKMDMLVGGLKNQLTDFEAMRKFPLSNSVPPAMQFNPLPIGFKIDTKQKKFKMSPAGKVKMPENMDDLAFYSVRQLGELIRTRQITSEKLTRFYL